MDNDHDLTLDTPITDWKQQRKAFHESLADELQSAHRGTLDAKREDMPGHVLFSVRWMGDPAWANIPIREPITRRKIDIASKKFAADLLRTLGNGGNGAIKP